jgi:hypothetical protein
VSAPGGAGNCGIKGEIAVQTSLVVARSRVGGLPAHERHARPRPQSLGAASGSPVLEVNSVSWEVVWQYIGTKRTFFSRFLGSAERLPNGNTLIEEGIWGRFFQVTPAGKIGWEYMFPFVDRGPGALKGIPWVYRIQAVPYSWLPAGVRQEKSPSTRRNWQIFTCLRGLRGAEPLAPVPWSVLLRCSLLGSQCGLGYRHRPKRGARPGTEVGEAVRGTQ